MWAELQEAAVDEAARGARWSEGFRNLVQFSLCAGKQVRGRACWRAGRRSVVPEAGASAGETGRRPTVVSQEAGLEGAELQRHPAGRAAVGKGRQGAARASGARGRRSGAAAACGGHTHRVACKLVGSSGASSNASQSTGSGGGVSHSGTSSSGCSQSVAKSSAGVGGAAHVGVSSGGVGAMGIALGNAMGRGRALGVTAEAGGAAQDEQGKQAQSSEPRAPGAQGAGGRPAGAHPVSCLQAAAAAAGSCS